MSSSNNCKSLCSVWTWLLAIETSPLSTSQSSCVTPPSPSICRKRQRSCKDFTPGQKRRRTSQSSDRLTKPVSKGTDGRKCKERRAYALVGKEPLRERSTGDEVFNMAANTNVRLTLFKRSTYLMNLTTAASHPQTLQPVLQLFRRLLNSLRSILRWQSHPQPEAAQEHTQ